MMKGYNEFSNEEHQKLIIAKKEKRSDIVIALFSVASLIGGIWLLLDAIEPTEHSAYWFEVFAYFGLSALLIFWIIRRRKKRNIKF